MQILFVAGFGPITRDIAASHGFYGDALGITFEGDPHDYLHTGSLDGCRHFAIWRLEDAAESSFGVKAWPADLPEPHAWIEFDVADMAAAVADLQASGHRLLVAAREEPWGQTVTRLLSPDGMLVGITITPWMRAPAGE